MKTHQHILFWILALVFLTTVFGQQYFSLVEAFYFVSMLLPVAIGTCYFFNTYLVPGYLLTQKYVLFGLYSLYMIVVSLYLEMIVITLSFIILAQYSYSNMNPIASNVFILTIAIYFIVLLFSFILLIKRAYNKERVIDTLEEEKRKQSINSLVVRSNRKMISLKTDEILYIESLGDYVKIHTHASEAIVTNTKIGALEKKLPDLFLRVHRSFLINKAKVESFSKEQVTLTNGKEIPISRSYKQSAWNALS